MKRITLFATCLCMLILGISSVFSQTQNNRLFASPFAIETNANSSPTFTDVGTTTGADNAFFYNAAFDVSGNMLFYVNSEHEIVDRWGNTLVLDDLDNGNRDIIGEIAIIRVPSYNDRFYIVFGAGTNTSLVGTRLLYTTVEFRCDEQLDIVRNSQEIPFVDLFDWINPGCMGIAVGKEINGQRFMYTKSMEHIQRLIVTATGIQHDGVISGSSEHIGCYELELSHDGTKLAVIGDDLGSGNKLHIINLNASGNSIGGSSYSLPGDASGLCGIEFTPNGDYLYLSWVVSGTISNAGVHRLNLSTGNFSMAGGALYPAFGATNLELGRDGRIYGLTTSGSMIAINPSSNAVNIYTVNSLPQGAHGTLSGRFVLPDQIDGDVYNFSIQTAPTVSNFAINDNQSGQGSVSIGCNDEIMLNGEESICGDIYFVSVRDLVTNMEHMEWLNATEIAQLMAGTFDLRDFCANPQLGSLAPTWSPSPSMPLIVGRCYEVKLVLTTSAHPWVASSQTMCITGSVDPTFQLVSRFEDCLDSEALIELLANEPSIPDNPALRYWSSCELDQYGEPITNTCVAYAVGQLGIVNNPSFYANEMQFEPGKCYRITQHIYDEECELWATHYIDVCMCCEGATVDPYFEFLTNTDPCALSFENIEIQAFEPGIPDNSTLRFWSSCALDANGNVLPNTCVAYAVGSLGNVNQPVFMPDEAQFEAGACYLITQHLYDESCGWVTHSETICLCEGRGKRDLHDAQVIDSELRIFPNPATDRLALEWVATSERRAKYVILDLQGRQLQSEELETSEGLQSHEINTTSLAPGQYFIQFHDEASIQTRIIVIQR